VPSHRDAKLKASESVVGCSKVAVKVEPACPATPMSSGAASSRGDAFPDGETIDSGDGDLVCCKCGELVSEASKGSLGKKSKQVIHGVCCAFYKTMAKKILKDTAYKSWWESRTGTVMPRSFTPFGHTEQSSML
jgi:hypothetical protein